MDTLRLAFAQSNLLVGDISGNADRVLAAAQAARAAGADLLITPELALAGYPPEDLLFHRGFRQQIETALAGLAAASADATRGTAILVGHPEYAGERLFNAATLYDAGREQLRHRKACLPNYRVFDEKRWFAAGTQPSVMDFRGFRIGVLVCEDLWEPEPAQLARSQGAEILLVLNASPYDLHKQAAREDIARRRAADVGLPIVYVNQVGGQDELVFDGQSFVTDAVGEVVLRAPAFEEALEIVEFRRPSPGAAPVPEPGVITPALDDEASVYRALVLGVRDYVVKNGFPGVVLGLSGGIDSALTLAIAVDALGAKRVRAVMMPSEYTAQISLDDSREMAAIHGVAYDEIAITPVFDAFKRALAGAFIGRPEDTAEENIQARVRGTMLMGLSNKFGAMVVTTGNKSEMAVGYSTLYGDMAGGYAILKDVSKTLVYQLCRWRNAQSRVIPDRVITRPPSAELRPDQKDQDSLPAYAVLDQIVEMYMEQDMAPAEIVAAGFAEADVSRVTRLLKINEYKRRQSPVGAKITRRGFGKDWRYPITSKYWPK